MMRKISIKKTYRTLGLDYNEIKGINGGKEGEYRKDLMEIKFNPDDNLPLNILLTFHMLKIVVRSVFEKDGKCYAQVVLDECLYKLWKCYSMNKLTFQKELTLIKQVHQNNVRYVIIDILKMLVINLNQMFVINLMMYW